MAIASTTPLGCGAPTTTHCLSMKNLKQQVLKTLERFIARQDHREKTNNNETKTRKRKWRTIKRVIPEMAKVEANRKWVQLAGHEDSFALGEEGTILKKLSENERNVLERIQIDALAPFVPKYKGVVNIETNQYIEMEDLLHGFSNPCVMDCKMGVRTYLEEELSKLEKNPELRPDMYEKMVKVNPNEPTAEEHAAKAITKPRYMQFREKLSSSATLGFRVEGIKNSEGSAFVDFKNCKERAEVQGVIGEFTSLKPHIIRQYLDRLKALRQIFIESTFFKTHEIIGSSLLFVHDDRKAGVWMIDFGKSMKLKPGVTIDHGSTWQRGNHEDGYLTGVDNLVQVLERLLTSV